MVAPDLSSAAIVVGLGITLRGFAEPPERRDFVPVIRVVDNGQACLTPVGSFLPSAEHGPAKLPYVDHQ